MGLGSELAGYGVAEGIDASSGFPQRLEGSMQTRTDTISYSSVQTTLGSEHEKEMQMERSVLAQNAKMKGWMWG